MGGIRRKQLNKKSPERGLFIGAEKRVTPRTAYWLFCCHPVVIITVFLKPAYCVQK